MSRLTSRAPFNRPSAFEVLPPRPAPLSPPETEMEALAMPQEPHQEDTNPVPPEATAQQTMTAESPAGHFRRISNLAYTSSSLSRREPRPTQRSQSRWLVMVVPPASLNREPPTLGHTLSSAPAGRFSSGILMPLFPTLYGQLTAIAREFNMPSTTGLCIYLQLQESGASMLTPRVSDESWPLLWGHFFVGDDRTAAQLPSHGLPISGRIEFDIDLRRARWFDAWMGHPRRERVESEIMSRDPSVVPTHWRGDSRTSLFPTELGAEDSPSPPAQNPPVTAVSSRTVVQRQLPRPLLLERRDAASIRSFSRHASRAPSISHEPPSPDAQKQELVLPSKEIPVSKVLSPVVQEQEEPQTARKIDLQTKVQQWRQSSSVTGATSNALAAAGQPSLDPVNMPSGADVELDLNDFAWSISSAGPPSESPMSADWPEPLPSVHLLGRLQGSVCLTPSTATSFGPLDNDWLESPVSCVSRRPSPDLGMRMMDYVPLTPTTATSWGPDDNQSPIHSEFGFEYRAPSVDIGVRGMGSRPVTPSTATSWGPLDSPLSFPPSPYYVRTPDAGERAFPELQARKGAARVLAFPYYSAWEGRPWGHVWPYQAQHHRSSTVITLSAPTRRVRTRALLPEWPDFASLYPSDPNVERAAENKYLPVELPREANYPFLHIYPTAYPYNLDEIYPVPSQPQQRAQVRSIQHREVNQHSPLPEWPHFASLYPSNPNVERAAGNKSLPIELPRQVNYPFLEIYPLAYPYNLDEIYPASQTVQRTYAERPQRQEIKQGTLLPEWPDFASLYPSDPHAERAAANKSQHVSLPGPVGYPFLEIYPTAYPYNLDEIYPASAQVQRTHARGPWHSEVKKGTLLPEWPHFASLYPSDPRVERAAANKSQHVMLPRPVGYPFLEIYPTAYPYNLEQIYPTTSSTLREDQGFTKTSGLTKVSRKEFLPEWPDFASLYPADPTVERAASNKSLPVTLRRPVDYPFIVVYEAVYPHQLEEIYPPLPSALVSGMTPRLPASVGRSNKGFANHPTLEYPDFAGLYPSERTAERTAANKSQPVSLPDQGYPFLSVYPSVYPWTLAEIYGPRQLTGALAMVAHELVDENTGISIQLPVNSGYPVFNLYPAPSGFPTFEIYPSVVPNSLATTVPSVKLTPSYPANDDDRPFYPNLVVYPDMQLAVAETPLPSRPTSPRKRTQTPGPGRRRTHGMRSPPIPGSAEDEEPRRLSRSSIQKDLAPPLPVAAVKDIATPRKSKLTHLDLHRRVFGTDEITAVSEKSDHPVPTRRKTHDELHRMVTVDVPIEDVPVEDVQGMMDDLVAELPPRPSPSPAPLRQRSRSGTVSSRPSTDISRSGSQRSIGIVPQPPRSSSPTGQERETHNELHMSVIPGPSSNYSEGLEDFVAELPRRTPSSSVTPVRQRSRSGTVSARVSADPLRKGSQGSAHSIADLSRSSTPVSSPRRRKTHHELHQAVFANLTYENTQRLDDFVAEVLPAPSTTPVRQRSRSGTVSSRTSQPPGPPPSFKPPTPPATSTIRARRPSVSTSVNMFPSETSPSPITVRSAPLPPPGTKAPFVSGLPGSPSPARESNVLSRVRSMNTGLRPTATAPQAQNAGGLDRSRSMSDARRGGANRQSIVLERAKMFTVSEKDVGISDVSPGFPQQPAGRPVSKLDRTKLPFA